MNISNESIVSLRNAVDNIIKQLIRTPDSSEDLDFRTEQIDHISDFGKVIDLIVDKYGYQISGNNLTPNRELLLCLYHFYQQVFEKEEPFNEDSRTRRELERILN